MGGGLAEVSLEPKICSLMAWKECPGSGSTKCDWSLKKTRGEFGSVVEIGFDSDPSTPLIFGFSFFIHPNMWSNDLFSITSTTTVFIGLVLVVAAEEQIIWPLMEKIRRIISIAAVLALVAVAVEGILCLLGDIFVVYKFRSFACLQFFCGEWVAMSVRRSEPLYAIADSSLSCGFRGFHVA